MLFFRLVGSLFSRFGKCSKIRLQQVLEYLVTSLARTRGFCFIVKSEVRPGPVGVMQRDSPKRVYRRSLLGEDGRSPGDARDVNTGVEGERNHYVNLCTWVKVGYIYMGQWLFW